MNINAKNGVLPILDICVAETQRFSTRYSWKKAGVVTTCFGGLHVLDKPNINFKRRLRSRLTLSLYKKIERPVEYMERMKIMPEVG